MVIVWIWWFIVSVAWRTVRNGVYTAIETVVVIGPI